MSEAMSIPTSNSGETTFQDYEEATPIATLAKSLLASLAEMITTIASIDGGQNNFLEFGCYLYRVTPAIMELKSVEYSPKNAMEILQSLYNNTQLAKEILRKFQEVGGKTPAHEVGATLKQLEGVIKLVGEDLSSLPPSTFREQEYAEIAFRALSEEMKRAHFAVAEVRPIQELKPYIQLPISSAPESQPEREETSSVSTESTVSREFSVGYSLPSDIPMEVQVLRSISTLTDGDSGQMSPGSLRSMRESAQRVEPLFQSFLCPLTKEIMDDPVTIQSGVTYERQAITAYFERFGGSDEVTCPTTYQKLLSRDFAPNIALKSTIDEWKERNENARIKVIRSALSTASTERMVLDALYDLQKICERRPNKRKELCNMGMIPLVAKLLEFRERKVRYSALEILQQLALEDAGKELIGKTTAITTTVRMLSSSHQRVRHSALSLLVEISKSKPLSEKIGWVTGGILMLIKIKYDTAVDPSASEAANQIINNLAQCPYNIKCMAENGFIDPLLDNLVEGSDEMKLKMATYLSEIVLGHNSSNKVAERASPALIQMMRSGNAMNRKAALRALAQLSSDSHNGGILVETGVVKLLVEEMFTTQNMNKPMDSLEEAAVTVANVLESGLELEDLKVTSEGHKLASAYTIFNIVHMITNSDQDEVTLSLIKILSCLTKSSQLTAALVTAFKESDASYKFVTFINHRNEEIRISALRLLITLSSHIGHMLADRICNTNGLLEGLLQSPSDMTHITETHVLSAKLLAELPHQNIKLNLALIEGNIVQSIVQMINQIQGSGTRPSRYAGAYLESIVGILVRFTGTIYEPHILSQAMNYRFTDIFTALLAEISSDEVKRLAATGLEKLSTESISLSKQPSNERRKATSLFCFSCGSEVNSSVPVCTVHKGVCSSENTFCLIEARAVEALLACLNHHNVAVVEAALLALSTLLDDKLDVSRSVALLNEMNATEKVMRVVREHKKESLLQKVFWMTEVFLTEGGHISASVVAQDRMFTATVVSAFHHGEPYTRQLAEKILRYLNKMPMYTTTFSSNHLM